MGATVPDRFLVFHLRVRAPTQLWRRSVMQNGLATTNRFWAHNHHCDAAGSDRNEHLNCAVTYRSR